MTPLSQLAHCRGLGAGRHMWAPGVAPRSSLSEPRRSLVTSRAEPSVPHRTVRHYRPGGKRVCEFLHLIMARQGGITRQARYRIDLCCVGRRSASGRGPPRPHTVQHPGCGGAAAVAAVTAPCNDSTVVVAVTAAASRHRAVPHRAPQSRHVTTDPGSLGPPFRSEPRLQPRLFLGNLSRPHAPLVPHPPLSQIGPPPGQLAAGWLIVRPPLGGWQPAALVGKWQPVSPPHQLSS